MLNKHAAHVLRCLPRHIGTVDAPCIGLTASKVHQANSTALKS